jgi:hypothetical protein
MPSSIRSRWRSSSSAPGAIPKASASSIVAGRTSRASTRAVAVSPRERPSSERLISAFGGSASASPVTNDARPRVSTSPSATSSSSARRTVARLTPSSSHSQRSDGRRSPAVNPPPSISAAICR